MTRPYPYPPGPPRKRRVWPWIVIVAACFVLFGGCTALVASTMANNPPVSHPANLPPAEASAILRERNGLPPTTDVAPPTTIPPLTAQAPVSAGKTITYEVISDATLQSVTYFDANDAEKQQTDVAAPWSLTVTNTSTYVIAGLGAQTNGQSVTCRITVDGQVVDQKTATGQYAVVNCTAPVG